MTVFPSITRRVEKYENVRNMVVFLSTLIIALVLISISIESIDSTLLVIGKEEENPEIFNEIRLIGFDFNKSTLFGLNNFYAVDYVIYEHTASDFLKVSVGEYYDSGTWYTDNKTTTPYNGETLPFDLSPELSTGVSDFTVWVMIDTERFVPCPEHPRNLTFLKMNYSRGVYEYTEAQSWNCSYDNTTQLFHTNRTISPWSKYIISFYDIKTQEKEPIVSQRSEERYTQIPDKIREEIQQRSEYVTEDAETDYEKIQALIEYLQTGYKFSYAWREAPYDTDPVIWFLFTDHNGISIHFNTALTLMARSIGIPARIVGGYPLGSGKVLFLAPWDRRVYAEVWCEDYGWVRFDATPEPVIEETEPTRSTTIRTKHKKKSVEVETPRSPIETITLVIGVIIGLVLVAHIINSLIEAGRKKQSEPETSHELIKEIDERLKVYFKEIPEDLPNIWHPEAPITLCIESQYSGKLALTIDDQTETSDYTSPLTIQLNFDKGLHIIKAALTTQRTETSIISIIGLRIVDYREEIVKLFNQVLQDPMLASNWWRLTAQEIKDRLRENYPELPDEALEKYASLFELADYSLHSVDRDAYVRFYRAKRELEEVLSGGEKR